MTYTIEHRVFSSNPSTRLVNSQTPGIGRVAAWQAKHLWLINNLGRDIQVAKETPDGNGLEVIASLDDTIYPDTDEESQFDLDMHAMLVDSKSRMWAINHYGVTRVVDISEVDNRRTRSLEMIGLYHLAGDVERFAMVNGCLAGSSPQGYSSPTPPEEGLLLTKPLKTLENSTEKPNQIPYEMHLADWGILTALSTSSNGMKIVIASGSRTGCFDMVENTGTEPLITALFELQMPFYTTWIHQLQTGEILLAGHSLPDPTITNQDWNQLGGGGWLLASSNGREIYRGSFDTDLAWGNGGDPLVLIEHDRILVGIDKMGGIHGYSIDSPRLLFERAIKHTDRSLGMAHADILNKGSEGSTIICGFNRDGYQLHKYDIVEKGESHD